MKIWRTWRDSILGVSAALGVMGIVFVVVFRLLVSVFGLLTQKPSGGN